MSKTIPATEYCSSIFDGTHGTPKASANGFPLVTSKNIIGEVLNLSDAYLISEEDYTSINKRSNISQWDILFSMIGTVGEVYLERDSNINYAIKNIGVFSCKDKKRAEWLFYYLKSPAAKKHIQRYLSGAVQKFLSLGALREFPVLPFDETASKAVAIVVEIDKKIELNNRINSELEAMAKIHYDYWFVQFDFPDANGKPYKSSGGKMVYNDAMKREIPESWSVKPISELITVKDGTHDSPKQAVSGFPLVTSKHLLKTGIDFDSAYLISKEDYEAVNKRSKVETGDILFSMIGSIGEVYKVDEKDINFAIKNVALYKSSSNPELVNYIYMYLKSYDMKCYMANVTKGSIQKFIGLGSLREMPLLVSDEIINIYVSTTKYIFDQMTIIKRENQELVALRDWLLPMLMNGQVTMK